MKVILMQDIENLGGIGEEIKVKDGFARNYLIPKNLVIKATDGALQVLEQKKRKKERQEKKIIEKFEVLAQKIAAASYTISMEAGEEDKLFGAVTSEMIAESLLAEGVDIDKKKIVLEEPLRSLGVFNIEIDLHPEVKAQARVWVVKK